MKVLFFAAMLTCAVMPILAHAQDAAAPAAAPAPRVGQACRADIQSFCPNMPAGQQRHSCIMTNLTKMTADCQAAFNAQQADMGDFHKVCGPDIKQYCKSAAAGPAKHQCIAQNEAQFSAGCQAELAKHPEKTRS